jgi:hypothetical protein
MAVTGLARPPSLVDVPQFVRAKTAQGLTRAMFENNKRLKAYVRYFDIQFAGGYWYAWFEIDLTKVGL